jgi:CBS domain-containing protein
MAGMTYKIIEIFTSEATRWHGTPLYEAIVQVVAKEKSAARCIVTKGVAGCFENGEVASHRVLDVSYNMPLKIEIILPSPELDRVLPKIEAMVTDGIIVVEESEIRAHRTTGGLLPRSVRVRDVMTTPAVAVGRDDHLREVVSVLVRSEFDSVPVVDGGGRLLGMIDQEHLVERAELHTTPGLLAAFAQGRAEAVPEAALFPVGSAALGAKEVMAAPDETIGPDELLTDAVRMMTKKNLKRLPVVDKEKVLVGMLSRIDVLRVASAGTSRRRVLERYGARVAGTTPLDRANLLEVPTVSPETPAREILDALDKEGRRVVVVDERGAPLGVISDKDLLPLLDPKAGKKIDELRARSLMRTVPTLPAGTSVEEALGWLVEHRRQRLPVVDDEGRYVGMLSREELLRILVPDGGDRP